MRSLEIIVSVTPFCEKERVADGVALVAEALLVARHNAQKVLVRMFVCSLILINVIRIYKQKY